VGQSTPLVFYFLQISWLHNKEREVVVVTSGTVAFGKLRMRQEQMLSQSVRHTISDRQTLGKIGSGTEPLESRACAAAGQAGLMALYEAMFAQYGVSCAQVGACWWVGQKGRDHTLVLRSAHRLN